MRIQFHKRDNRFSQYWAEGVGDPNAKRAGEIKSQPWAELKRREAYMFGDKRLKIFRAYAQEMTGEYVSIGDVKRYSKAQIAALGQFISANNGLFGGKYE